MGDPIAFSYLNPPTKLMRVETTEIADGIGYVHVYK